MVIEKKKKNVAFFVSANSDTSEKWNSMCFVSRVLVLSCSRVVCCFHFHSDLHSIGVVPWSKHHSPLIPCESLVRVEIWWRKFAICVSIIINRANACCWQCVVRRTVQILSLYATIKNNVLNGAKKKKKMTTTMTTKLMSATHYDNCRIQSNRAKIWNNGRKH